MSTDARSETPDAIAAMDKVRGEFEQQFGGPAMVFSTVYLDYRRDNPDDAPACGWDPAVRAVLDDFVARARCELTGVPAPDNGYEDISDGELRAIAVRGPSA